ncbi:hypothetical protein INT45_005527 [Circinella minor]|uniref:Uncharacterized protein n=1 Tax=Circinella minor TaxID=1195481 RepID=A0A8H7RUN0_9FUNG|nr:hypothetical protein INT45_005527 [Circinella minor]
MFDLQAAHSSSVAGLISSDFRFLTPEFDLCSRQWQQLLDIDDLNNHSNTSNASCNATSSDAMTTRHSHSTQHSASLPSHLQDPVS